MFSKRDKLNDPCQKCGAFVWRVGTATTASGSIVNPYFCGGCGAKTQLYERKLKAKSMGCATEVHIEVRHHRHCEVCAAQGAEEHHWAPRFLFGSDAEKWPKAMLCIACHLKWHTLVTPRMSSNPPINRNCNSPLRGLPQSGYWQR